MQVPQAVKFSLLKKGSWRSDRYRTGNDGPHQAGPAATEQSIEGQRFRSLLPQRSVACTHSCCSESRAVVGITSPGLQVPSVLLHPGMAGPLPSPLCLPSFGAEPHPCRLRHFEVSQSVNTHLHCDTLKCLSPESCWIPGSGLRVPSPLQTWAASAWLSKLPCLCSRGSLFQEDRRPGGLAHIRSSDNRETGWDAWHCALSGSLSLSSAEEEE